MVAPASRPRHAALQGRPPSSLRHQDRARRVRRTGDFPTCRGCCIKGHSCSGQRVGPDTTGETRQVPAAAFPCLFCSDLTLLVKKYLVSPSGAHSFWRMLRARLPLFESSAPYAVCGEVVRLVRHFTPSPADASAKGADVRLKISFSDVPVSTQSSVVRNSALL